MPLRLTWIVLLNDLSEWVALKFHVCKVMNFDIPHVLKRA
jgi:hypothetical protein